MRRCHRWLSTAFVVFLFYLFVTGTATGIAQLLDPESAAPIPPSAIPGVTVPGSAPTVPMPAGDVSGMIATVVESAIASVPDSEATTIRLQLRIVEGNARGIITIDELNAAFDARTGEAAAVPRPDPGLMPPLPEGYDHLPVATLLQEYHSGRMFGRIGEWVMLCTGIAVVAISFTGIPMYLSLWKRRRRNGRAELFW